MQSELRKITDIHLPFDPKVFLLRDFSQCFGIFEYNIFIDNAIVTAKLLVAGGWKSLQIPLKNDWLMKMCYILLMNKL